MNTLLELMQAGGPAMPALILLFLLFVPCSLVFALFSYAAQPSRRRVRLFARAVLVAGIVFVLLGMLGFARGTWILEQALATEEIGNPARLEAIGRKEARLPLWTGLLFAGVAAGASGLFFGRSRRLSASAL